MNLTEQAGHESGCRVKAAEVNEAFSLLVIGYPHYQTGLQQGSQQMV
ncbi:hypothetical protein GCM10027098_02870 [Bowmanella dokdonensis]